MTTSMGRNIFHSCVAIVTTRPQSSQETKKKAGDLLYQEISKKFKVYFTHIMLQGTFEPHGDRSFFVYPYSGTLPEGVKNVSDND